MTTRLLAAAVVTAALAGTAFADPSDYKGFLPQNQAGKQPALTAGAAYGGLTAAQDRLMGQWENAMLDCHDIANLGEKAAGDRCKAAGEMGEKLKRAGCRYISGAWKCHPGGE
jgi:hypothetical protein